ncbi:MAG: flagellar hook-basal body complex protein FliE [Candidatus Kapabacteria bacterium]|jgi:flagellar hook-basal body complex protein FliE|nr:flagellar hook-basal body complex protein FliE [Candidatus Kapabacteria bacterium]
MITNELSTDKLYLPLVQEKMNNTQVNQKGDETFADALRGFVGDVNNQQIESKNMTESFIKGEPVDIHDVMITVEKAKTSFELLMELRNKGLDLYREVLRMQI